MLSKDELIETAKKKLDELSVELDELKAESDRIGVHAKEQYNEGVKELNGLIDEAQLKLDEEMDASEESWKHIENQREITAKALKQSFNYFKSQIK